jgi:lipopolysaccharide/colanic/teichoic acid biosynthesis glycosyltransferase
LQVSASPTGATMRAGVPMLTLFDRPISGWAHVMKLIEDRAIALAALAFLAPLMLSIAVAIKLDSRGPVLFKQRRFGFNDRPIEVWMFRTMISGIPGIGRRHWFSP